MLESDMGVEAEGETVSSRLRAERGTRCRAQSQDPEIMLSQNQESLTYQLCLSGAPILLFY